MAKYHLGKVKLERVGQRSLPTPVRDLRGGPRGIAGPLMCALLLELHCIVALLADRSGSIFAFLRIIITDSCSLSSLPAWWFRNYFLR